MKHALRKFVRSLGYDVQRFGPSSDSLHEIARLLADVQRPVIFDVGAHYGQTATKFAALFPQATLYCFEPFPESFAHLQANAAKYRSAKLEPMGFSDRRGQQEFHCNASSPTNSLLQLESTASQVWNNSALSPVKKVACDFDTLDHYLQANRIQCVDLLKLDVQGAEYKVLEGAQSSLRAGLIRNIYLEIIVARTYAQQRSFGDYLALLESFGFRLQGLFNFEHGAHRELLQLDGLFALAPGAAAVGH